jgi:hypothetical protein
MNNYDIVSASMNSYFLLYALPLSGKWYLRWDVLKIQKPIEGLSTYLNSIPRDTVPLIYSILF